MGDPHHCYYVMVLFDDLIVLSVLVRYITKGYGYKEVLYLEIDHG